MNFQKSEILTVGGDDSVVKEYAELFNCDIGSFPIKYLGPPLHHCKLRREDLQPVIDKIIKRGA